MKGFTTGDHDNMVSRGHLLEYFENLVVAGISSFDSQQRDIIKRKTTFGSRPKKRVCFAKHLFDRVALV